MTNYPHTKYAVHLQDAHFIVFNGPPSSGKSTAARLLCQALGKEAVMDSFAAPMKHFIATALGMTYADMAKDAPRAELSGYSVREFLIDLSEHYIKERYGAGVFGRWLYHRIGRLNPSPKFVICDDGGFIDEIEALPMRRTTLVHVYRQGCSFQNDSRNYVHSELRRTVVLHNTGTTEQLHKWINAFAMGAYDE